MIVVAPLRPARVEALVGRLLLPIVALPAIAGLLYASLLRRGAR